MPAQYPASIILTNFGNGTDQYQKTVEIDFPAGPVYVEPGAHQQITLDAAHPSIVLRVGRWAVGYPDGAIPLAPVMQFSYTSPVQNWHGVWSDAPGVRVHIDNLTPTSIAFNGPDDTRTFTIEPGRF